MATVMPPFRLDFSLFPDNQVLGPSFSLAILRFETPHGGQPLAVCTRQGHKGMQFPRQGAQVSLPAAASHVRLCLGVFAAPVFVETRDEHGAALEYRWAEQSPQPVELLFQRGPIYAISLVKGADEGLIIRLILDFAP